MPDSQRAIAIAQLKLALKLWSKDVSGDFRIMSSRGFPYLAHRAKKGLPWRFYKPTERQRAVLNHLLSL